MTQQVTDIYRCAFRRPVFLNHQRVNRALKLANRRGRHGLRKPPEARSVGGVRGPAGHRAQVVIMAKVPLMGRVKTRLGADIGAVAATMFYRHAAHAVMARLGADSRWKTIIAVAPDSGIASSAWPCQISRIPQGGGNLGARMQRVFNTARPGPVLIIGTDIPQIGPHHIASALRQVRSHGAVVGPSGDGGYWLIGLKRIPRTPQVFDNVRWSSRETLNDTLANLDASKIGTRGNRAALSPGNRTTQVAIAPTLNDVDDGADFMTVRHWAGRVVLPVGV